MAEPHAYDRTCTPIYAVEAGSGSELAPSLPAAAACVAACDAAHGWHAWLHGCWRCGRLPRTWGWLRIRSSPKFSNRAPAPATAVLYTRRYSRQYSSRRMICCVFRFRQKVRCFVGRPRSSRQSSHQPKAIRKKALPRTASTCYSGCTAVPS
jgi:hypothetical protein